MHTYVSKLTIIGSVNGQAPSRRKEIIWTNAGILLIEPLETNFNEFESKFTIVIYENPFENVVWKMADILSRFQCVNLTYELCLYGIIVSHSEERRLFQAGLQV